MNCYHLLYIHAYTKRELTNTQTASQHHVDMYIILYTYMHSMSVQYSDDRAIWTYRCQEMGLSDHRHCKLLQYDETSLQSP